MALPMRFVNFTNTLLSALDATPRYASITGDTLAETFADAMRAFNSFRITNWISDSLNFPSYGWQRHWTLKVWDEPTAVSFFQRVHGQFPLPFSHWACAFNYHSSPTMLAHLLACARRLAPGCQSTAKKGLRDLRTKTSESARADFLWRVLHTFPTSSMRNVVRWLQPLRDALGYDAMTNHWSTIKLRTAFIRLRTEVTDVVE